MSRNVRKISAKRRQDIEKEKRTVNREKDTRYWVRFLPIAGRSVPTGEEPKWLLEVSGNPDRNPEVLDGARTQFADGLGISSWEQAASGHKVEKQWFG